MTFRVARSLVPAALLLAVAGGGMLAARPASAQSAVERLKQSPVLPRAGQDGARKEIPPPTAIPGATAAPSAVAPASKVAADMAPNEALFDAINRGDIAAARDAMTRGADLSATNVLGMTPIELSIDLNRRDIEFLLLSLRGDDGSSMPPPGARGPQSASAQPAKRTPAEIRADRRAEAVAARAARSTKQPAAVASATAAPQLFANNGGTPIPQSGFLGFNGR